MGPNSLGHLAFCIWLYMNENIHYTGSGGVWGSAAQGSAKKNNRHPHQLLIGSLPGLSAEDNQNRKEQSNWKNVAWGNLFQEGASVVWYLSVGSGE